MAKRPITKESLFEVAQSPSQWLFAARKLFDAAVDLIGSQKAKADAYLRARDDAERAAVLRAIANGQVGIVEILAQPPNYLAAEMLLAFALENALKGLIIASDPSAVGKRKLDRRLTSHDLTILADRAGFSLHVTEQEIAKSLSLIAIWAGRYPVARDVDQHTTVTGDGRVQRNPGHLLDWGSRHPLVLDLVHRAVSQLNARCGSPDGNDVLIVWNPLAEPGAGLGG